MFRYRIERESAINSTPCRVTSSLWPVEFSKEVMQVEWIGEHLQRPVGLFRPFLFRSVPVELNAIVVWIAQVEGLADPVIARTLEGDLGDDQPSQSIGQQPPGRVKNGGMVKTGRTRGRRGATEALPGIKSEVVVITAGRDERGAGPAGRELKTQHTTVKIERPLEVRDFQMDMADAHPGVDRGHLHGIFFEDVGLRHDFILAGGTWYPHM